MRGRGLLERGREKLRWMLLLVMLLLVMLRAGAWRSRHGEHPVRNGHSELGSPHAVWFCDRSYNKLWDETEHCLCHPAYESLEPLLAPQATLPTTPTTVQAAHLLAAAASADFSSYGRFPTPAVWRRREVHRRPPVAAGVSVAPWRARARPGRITLARSSHQL